MIHIDLDLGELNLKLDDDEISQTRSPLECPRDALSPWRSGQICQAGFFLVSWRCDQLKLSLKPTVLN